MASEILASLYNIHKIATRLRLGATPLDLKDFIQFLSTELKTKNHKRFKRFVIPLYDEILFIAKKEVLYYKNKRLAETPFFVRLLQLLLAVSIFSVCFLFLSNYGLIFIELNIVISFFLFLSLLKTKVNYQNNSIIFFKELDKMMIQMDVVREDLQIYCAK